MKQQAKLYREYLEWINKQNRLEYKKFQKHHKKEINSYLEQENFADELYKKRLKAYERSNEKEIEEYESLGFIKKFFAQDPRSRFGFGWSGRPRRPFLMPPIISYAPKQKESYKGFMRWLSEVKYKDKGKK